MIEGKDAPTLNDSESHRPTDIIPIILDLSGNPTNLNIGEAGPLVDQIQDFLNPQKPDSWFTYYFETFGLLKNIYTHQEVSEAVKQKIEHMAVIWASDAQSIVILNLLCDYNLSKLPEAAAETPFIELFSPQTKEEICAQIKDKFPGIPDWYLGNIYEPNRNRVVGGKILNSQMFIDYKMNHAEEFFQSALSQTPVPNAFLGFAAEITFGSIAEKYPVQAMQQLQYLTEKPQIDETQGKAYLERLVRQISDAKDYDDTVILKEQPHVVNAINQAANKFAPELLTRYQSLLVA